MTATGTTDPQAALRSQLHGMWSSVAGAWGANAEFVDDRGAHLTERLLELARPRVGDRVLELACGTGGPGLAAAPLVGPTGEVVLSDVAAEMVAIAAGRAEARGLRNVASRVLDLESIDEPDDSYDVVYVREGLMLVPDPVGAAREIKRVLKPGGSAALTVWGPRARNPWLGIVFDAVSAQLGSPVPPPGLPQPFSLDDADRLERVLTAAGLARVDVHELAVPYRAASVGEWWQRTCELAGPLAQRLAALPAPEATALRDRAAAAIAKYVTAAGLEIPGVCLVASAVNES